MHRKRLTIEPEARTKQSFGGLVTFPKFNPPRRAGFGNEGATEVQMGRLCSDPHRTLAQLRFAFADDAQGDKRG
jgi:hypothetical protein